ncbi:MAG: hypothetical protein AAGJ40_07335 [Planctomycetota bacterium]
MIRFRLLVAVLVLFHAYVSFAEDDNARGRLVFVDDFDRKDSGGDRDDVGRGWRTNAHEPWSRAPKQTRLHDGVLHVFPEDAEGASVIVYRYTHFLDGSIGFRFQLPHVDDQITLVLADNSLEGVHAGHVLAIRLEPGRIRLSDMLSGSFAPDIYRRRQLGESTSADAQQIAACRRVHPVPIEVAHWHHVQVRVEADRLMVEVDGHPAGEFRSPGFANRKTELRITIPRYGMVDDFELRISDPVVMDEPKHVLITARTEQKFRSIGASAIQMSRLDELSRAHRGYVHDLRSRVGITKELIRQRDHAFKEAQSRGLENRELWKYVQQQVQLSDQQTEAFRVTLERHQQFRTESLELLDAEQRKAFREAPVSQRAASPRKSSIEPVESTPATD